MEKILQKIKKEAIRQRKSIWALLEDCDYELHQLNEEVEKIVENEEIKDAMLEEIKNEKHFFIEKDAIYNVWYTKDIKDLEEVDEEGYVELMPIAYYMHLPVKKESLVKITKKEAIRLIKAIKWDEDRSAEVDEVCQALGDELLAKYAS